MASRERTWADTDVAAWPNGINGSGAAGNFALDINVPNTIESGILDAFQITRNGNNAPLFDQMLKGFNLGLGAINGTTVTGSASLRQNSATRGLLANGDVAGLANYLARTAPPGCKPGDYIRTNGLPENLIITNPQLGPARLWTNSHNSTYHSLSNGGNWALSCR